MTFDDFKKMVAGQPMKKWKWHRPFEKHSSDIVDEDGEFIIIRDSGVYPPSVEECEYIMESYNIMPKLIAVVQEYERFVETMTGINQHMGYQFTQPIFDGTKALRELKETMGEG